MSSAKAEVEIVRLQLENDPGVTPNTSDLAVPAIVHSGVTASIQGLLVTVALDVVNGESGGDLVARVHVSATVKPHTLASALRTYPFDPSVDSVQVLLKT